MKKGNRIMAILALALCMLPMKVAAMKSTNAVQPVMAFASTPAYGENAPYLGVVFTEDGSPFDASKYRVMLWLEYYGYWPKPTYDQSYTDLNSDGSFTYVYCSSTNDVYAKALHFFLVPSGYVPDFGDKSASAREKAFAETKSKAIDYVLVERNENGDVKVEPYREAPVPEDVAPAIPSGLLPVKQDRIAVDVGFYTVEGTVPDQNLSEDLIRSHLLAVSRFSDTVRFYKATGAIEKAYRIAKEMGLTVIGSAYLNTDKENNKKEMDGLVKLCKEGCCKIAVVGNEVLMNHFLEPDELVSAINYVRDGIADPAIPVTTSENYDQLLSTPSVRNACSFLFVNHYPFLGGADIGHAAEYFASNIRVLQAVSGDKEIVASETGWPTYPSEENAVRYYKDIREWSLKNNIQVCFFESTDEKWKGDVGDKLELDRHWGFMTNDFAVKECYKGLNPFDLYTEVSSISLTPKTLELVIGEEASLTAVVSPGNATDKTITWSSSAKGIASVDDNGKVKALKRGTSTITAASVNGKSDICKVMVKNIEPTGITVDPEYLTLRVGETATLKALVEPENTTDPTVSWNSQDSSIVKVDDAGNITAIAPGYAFIRAMVYEYDSMGYMNAFCKVNVLPEKTQGKHPVISFTFTPSIGDGNDFKGFVHMEDGSGFDPSQYRVSCWLEYSGSLFPKPTYATPYATINQDGSFSLKYWTGRNDRESTLLYFFLIPSSFTPGTFAETSNQAVDFVRVERHADGRVNVVPDRTNKDPAACRSFGFCTYNNKQYWYENWQRQGIMDDPKNIIGDGSPRGREIYDPESDGWYWLDSIYDGAKAQGKEVWVPYIYQDEDKWNDSQKRNISQESDAGMGEYVYKCMREKSGKWVRYDNEGKMLKGWVTIQGGLAKAYPRQAGNTYYYDTRTGLMAKGYITIQGRLYHFDEITGVLINE